VLDDARVLNELARLRDDGIRVGLSLSGPRQKETLARALPIERDGRRLFESVQATWNLLEPSAGEALAQAHAAGIGVIVKEALANGHLAGREDASGDASPYADAQRALATEARRLDVSVDALALAAALAQPWADCVLSGAARVEHVQSNLAALSLSAPTEVFERLGELAVTPADYWARRAKSVWT
jgi:aryl-alcohol dehydrogenase-like predicted oxidoreductase